MEGKEAAETGCTERLIALDTKTKLHGLLYQSAASSPEVSDLGGSQSPWELRACYGEKTHQWNPGLFPPPSFSFKRINCHLPTQSGCSLPWPPSSHPQMRHSLPPAQIGFGTQPAEEVGASGAAFAWSVPSCTCTLLADEYQPR